MRAMILAAGRGDRLRPITDRLPKPLVEVAGKTLIERHLETFASAGIDTVVINLGWHGDQIADRLGSGERYGLSVVYSPEYDHILETGGGIRRALPMLGDKPFWVVNGDIWTNFRPTGCPLADDDLAHLVLVPRPDHRPHGDFRLDRTRVLNGPSPDLTYSGVGCYRPALFADTEPGRFPLAPLLRRAADAGRLSGECHRGHWTDVGTPERLADLERTLATKGHSDPDSPIRGQ